MVNPCRLAESTNLSVAANYLFQHNESIALHQWQGTTTSMLYNFTVFSWVSLARLGAKNGATDTCSRRACQHRKSASCLRGASRLE
jgi:hypothetical protein